MNKKAIVLFSGGLDSILAAKVIMDQGIDLVGMNFIMEFAARDIEAHKEKIRQTASQINLETEIIDISKEFLHLLKKPPHGFGGHMNPCIDCKIFMLKKAKSLMKKYGAAFVITGEVLGERPMSQHRKSLEVIEAESGLKDYLLRPLSAKLLPETKIERQNLVDREKLFDIHGRSRNRQLALAKELKIHRFFTPAGGCLLTDPVFSEKLKDLIKHKGLALDEVKLLKSGRHFRFDSKTKFILGRDQRENRQILRQKKENDMLFEPYDFSGPVGILRGKQTGKNIELAAGFVISHSKRKDQPCSKIKTRKNKGEKVIVTASAVKREVIDGLRI